MNMLKQLNQTAIALAVLCLAQGVNAAEYNPSWYITPSLNVVNTDHDFGAGSRGYGAGLRLGKPISDMWDMQIGGSYMRAKENDARFRQNLLGIDMLYMFSRSTFRPFVLLGVGAERDDVSNSLRSMNRTSPYASLGIGFQSALNEQWSFQADLRHVHGYLRGNDFAANRARQNYLTLGLSYAFDAMPAPARPVARAPDPAPIVMSETAPAPMPPAAPLPPRIEKTVLSATELFAFNSAVLKSPQPKLDEIANALNANSQVDNVHINGHADRIGSEQYNLNLSQQRAQAVKTYLVEKGVNETRMTASGKGESEPVVQCNEKKRAALIVCLEPNRRVEIEQITIERRVAN